MTHRAPLLLAGLLASGCVAAPAVGDATEQDVTGATTYVDILDFSRTDQGAWYDAIHRLNSDLLAACSAGGCPSDAPRLTPLTFGCSVTSKAGTVHDCAWTFASAAVAVDAQTAAISTDAPTYECHVAAKTTAVTLAQRLGATDALHAALPGAASVFDQIGGCFAHPVGGTPITPSAPGTYVAASDYYSSTAGRARWAAAQAALRDGFDQVCGDTFCGSDYGDLQSMVFECAVTKSTGRIKGCTWVFAGSFHTVASAGGALQETAKTFRCAVPVQGTLPQLISTLTAATTPGGPDAIHRALPGGTATAYDALAGCLP